MVLKDPQNDMNDELNPYTLDSDLNVIGHLMGQLSFHVRELRKEHEQLIRNIQDSHSQMTIMRDGINRLDQQNQQIFRDLGNATVAINSLENIERSLGKMRSDVKVLLDCQSSNTRPEIKKSSDSVIDRLFHSNIMPLLVLAIFIILLTVMFSLSEVSIGQGGIVVKREMNEKKHVLRYDEKVRSVDKK